MFDASIYRFGGFRGHLEKLHRLERRTVAAQVEQLLRKGFSMEYPKLGKTRRNLYMGQEYLDLEAIAVNERKRTGRDISVSDLVRRACAEFADVYWSRIATAASAKSAVESQRGATDI
jgi:hypothetical protein